MWVSPIHLVADAMGNIVKIEGTLFLGHLRMKYHLKQQVAQFVTQRVKITPINRIRDFVGFFNGVRSDRRETLFTVPGTAILLVSELFYNFK